MLTALFCPATRSDRYGKALDVADRVIIDLEDGVGDANKADGRAQIAAAAAALPAERLIVRINAAGTRHASEDLSVIADTTIATVMLPKADDPDAVAALAPLQVVALCETARGVLAAAEIASVPNCVALMWGGEDLIADSGGSRSRRSDGTYLPIVTHARMHVLLAATASRTPAWDGVYLAIDDLSGLRAEAEEGAAMGFVTKVAIHPTQLPIIRSAYASRGPDVAAARALLEAAERAGGGVFRFRDQMVDGPLIAQAQATVAAAEGSLQRSAQYGGE
jgi:citrate lyase subunit beta/citryl-CoA lyase